MRLGTVRPTHVANYIDAMSRTFAPASVCGDVDVLFEIFKTAKREELVDTNPAEGAERPKIKRQRWRILEPVEVARIGKAFTDQQPRTVFWTLVITGLRRSELQALRWHDVDLIENVIRVGDSKTDDGVRSIAIPPALSEQLWQWRRVSNYRGDDERAFSNQKTGGVYREEHFAESFTEARHTAGITDYVRPFHDLRHTAITNDAASGASPIAVMSKAGHASMGTTKRYLHLAGVVFREEAAALERRFGLSPELSTGLASPEPISPDPNGLNTSVQGPGNPDRQRMNVASERSTTSRFVPRVDDVHQRLLDGWCGKEIDLASDGHTDDPLAHIGCSQLEVHEGAH